jgi:hypothetical protein
VESVAGNQAACLTAKIQRSNPIDGWRVAQLGCKFSHEDAGGCPRLVLGRGAGQQCVEVVELEAPVCELGGEVCRAVRGS